MKTLPSVEFYDATRSQCKASILIEGLSGRGKSALAIILAYYLSDQEWDKVFACDTENRSLNLLHGIPMHTGFPFGTFRKFDLTRVHGYRPTFYEHIMNTAIQQGAKAFVADSITHAWQGKGGILELQSEKQGGDPKKKYTAWGDPEVVAEKEAMYAIMRNADVHIIHTVRVKEKFEIGDGKMQSLGEQQMQMPDLKFEPDLVLQMIQAGSIEGRAPKARIIKSRYAILVEGETYEFTEELILQLKAYLEEGTDPQVLLDMQRAEYIRELKSILDNNASKRTVWEVLKADHGLQDKALDDMTLSEVRQMYSILFN